MRWAACFNDLLISSITLSVWFKFWDYQACLMDKWSHRFKWLIMINYCGSTGSSWCNEWGKVKAESCEVGWRWVTVQDWRRSREWRSKVLGPAHEFSQLRLILPLHVGTHSWPASLLETDVHQGSSLSFFFFLFETVFLCETKPRLYKNAPDGNFGRCCAWKWGQWRFCAFSFIQVVLKTSLLQFFKSLILRPQRNLV